MASHWYYAKDNTKHGPLSGREIKQLADSGELQPVDLVWKTGMADWQPARMVSGLFPTNQSKPADPPPIPTGNASTKTQPSDASSEERSATMSPKPAGPEDSSMNASELHSTAKRLIGSSLNAVRENVAESQTQNAIAKFKSFCGTIWSGSLNFWIRFSAWYLGVLRRIIHANNPPGELVATEAFPLRHVVVAEATDRASAVPRAAFLGKVIQWTLVMLLGAGIAGSVYDPGGGTIDAEQAKEDLLETARKMEGPFARVVQDIVERVESGFHPISIADRRILEGDPGSHRYSRETIAAYEVWRSAIIAESSSSSRSSHRSDDVDVSTVAEADTEFMRTAGRMGEREQVSARMLVELRRDDHWSWDDLDSEVEFQFGSIAREFRQWRDRCIALGDD